MSVIAVNWEAVSAIGQVVGAVAVVISRVYLTTEVRNSARATRLSSMRFLSDAINQYFKTCAEDADLAEVWFCGIHDFQSIKGADLMQRRPRFRQKALPLTAPSFPVFAVCRSRRVLKALR